MGWRRCTGCRFPLSVKRAGDVAEGIRAEFADEADVRSGARGGYSLVGAFAAGAELEGLAHAGLAPGGEAVDAEGDVGDVAAQDGDAVVGHAVDLSFPDLSVVDHL